MPAIIIDIEDPNTNHITYYYTLLLLALLRLHTISAIIILPLLLMPLLLLAIDYFHAITLILLRHYDITPLLAIIITPH
jgi:hypothetical protein